MQLVHGWSEAEADKLAATLLELLTPNNVLEEEIVFTGVARTYIKVTVSFRKELDMDWFSLDVLLADTQTNALASIGSSYIVKDGLPNIRPDCYDVILKKGKGKQYTASGMNTFKSDVYNEVAFSNPEVYERPITKAMQLMERIELGLKAKFES